MLTKFDWLRRCRTGAELIATLNYFSRHDDLKPLALKPGPPFSALGRVCHRCTVYASVQQPKKHHRYCEFCREILLLRRQFITKSQYSIMIWGYVNYIPQRLQSTTISEKVYGIYIHDEKRFLISMLQYHIKEWLQDLILYAGSNIKGLLQIFPSVGHLRNLTMGDYLAWAIHHEATLPMNQLRIRFFTSPRQLINPKARDQDGLLTFNISEFLNMLEMVEVFRAYLRPHEQKELYQLLNLKDVKEEQFYWGRFLGQLSQETKDMLAAWKIRQWPKNQIEFLYHLLPYVVCPQST